jgi:hypothetical protein
MFNGANYGQQDGVGVVHFQATANGLTTNTTMDESIFLKIHLVKSWVSTAIQPQIEMTILTICTSQWRLKEQGRTRNHSRSRRSLCQAHEDLGCGLVRHLIRAIEPGNDWERRSNSTQQLNLTARRFDQRKSQKPRKFKALMIEIY